MRVLSRAYHLKCLNSPQKLAQNYYKYHIHPRLGRHLTDYQSSHRIGQEKGVFDFVARVTIQARVDSLFSSSIFEVPYL